MSEEDLLQNIDSLLFQCALKTRELSQKKNEINQQIKVYRDDIAKAKSNIETTKTKIKGLEEDIKTKQNTLAQSKAIAKSMKSTNSLLLHYEQSLKAELESRKATYYRDKEDFEKRMASYRATYQSYKEFYYNNPLAQKLLLLQAENREIEAKNKSYDEQIMLKQEELNNLKAPAIQAPSPKKPMEGVLEQPPEIEPEKQPEQDNMEDNDTSIQPIEEGHIPAEAVPGEDAEEDQNASAPCLPAVEEDTVISQQEDEQYLQEETETEEKDQEAVPKDPSSAPHHPSIEEQFTVLEIEQAMEVEMDEGPEVDQESIKEADETHISLSQVSSQETTHQASPGRTTAGLATPTFPFTFSPGRSSQISNSSKSPAFSFNLQSDPSTPGFFGFGTQDEDTSSPFTSSFFGDKKTSESKTSMEFLFNQPEPSEDFQFSFNNKSPDKKEREKDKARDDFPFSFNF